VCLANGLEMKRVARNVERLSVWNRIYATEGMRWGFDPSQAARLAVEGIREEMLPPGLVVDMGCGYGRDLLLLSRAYRSRECIGIEGAAGVAELWEAMVSRRSGAADDRSHGRMSIKLCDVFALDETFGFRRGVALAFANYVFHLLDTREALGLMRRIGAALCWHGYFAGSFVATADATFGTHRRVGRNRERTDDGIWQYFDEADVRTLLDAAHLEIVSLQRVTEIAEKRGRPDVVTFWFAIARKPQ